MRPDFDKGPSPASTHRGPSFEVQLERAAESVGEARHLVADHLLAHRCPSRLIDAAVLVTSELATNAIMHAATPFALRCTIDQEVRIEVVDHQPDGDVSPVVASEGFGGHGLHIVASACRAWGVTRGIDHKTVWCELDG